MSTVPYTIVMLEETPEGPEFFTEVARSTDLDITTAKAIRQALDEYEQDSPRVKVLGIFKGNFESNWTSASSVRGKR